ncbi:Cysteine protease atg4 [Malassezia vespertilionis]|uniref:Cysteine protease n=1 Tax=Malassezia vespertilionis TaxID=2020962 RepID=A0A2N1JAJ6_9BASI|nr:Cysteine protease atg4 [Malassezia vespertilionis]PKI83580.1 Atg4p [Malassezia vespertilionis]WFD07227.1 Cysteine protease atg4 [Malassezia vespertilionis]
MSEKNEKSGLDDPDYTRNVPALDMHQSTAPSTPTANVYATSTAGAHDEDVFSESGLSNATFPVATPLSHAHHRSNSFHNAPPKEDGFFARRIALWAARVATDQHPEGVTQDTCKPEEPRGSGNAQAHTVRRWNKSRVSRTVNTEQPGSAAEKLAERRQGTSKNARVSSMLWHMTSDRVLRPWALLTGDQGVWLLGQYYGPNESAGRGMRLMRANSTGSGSSSARSAITDSSAVPDMPRMDPASDLWRKRQWRLKLEQDVGSLIWCTYRNKFPPIAHDGHIGADEEATSAAVSAATEELCCVPEKESATQGEHTPTETQADNACQAPPSYTALAHLLTHPTEVLYNTTAARNWLLVQLENRGWQLPRLLAQLPVAAGLQGSNDAPTPTIVASSIQTIFDTVERDVVQTIRGPIAASIPIARWRESLVSLSDTAGVPALWGYVNSLYRNVSSITRPAGLTSDAGWGCMLRSVQSLLANALIRVQLGQDWRVPSNSDATRTVEYARYTRTLSWFFDDPSMACPFSIHRLASEGKKLGMDIGSWFGPSTAAAAAQKLVDNFPACGMGIVVTNDGLVCIDKVRRLACTGDGSGWERPVLILVAQRLGLHTVPVSYRSSLKQTFSFPQSVGIAGGRPSSSLYFIGTQRDQLLYLDPHTVRPSVPFRHPPPSLQDATLPGGDAPEQSAMLLQSWYCHAYSTPELVSYHTNQAQQMSIAGMDPSMLFGFLCTDEASLLDLKERVQYLEMPLFSIGASPPSRDTQETATGDWTEVR